MSACAIAEATEQTAMPSAGGDPNTVEDAVWPSPEWQTATPAELGMDGALLDQARDYALTGGGSGMVIRGGKLVHSWGDPAQLYDLKSTTKSIGSAALGLALLDHRLSLTDPAQQHLPGVGVPPARNAATGWLDNLTILHLATQTAGFDKVGGFTGLLFEPGTAWSYSDGGINWLADILTAVYGSDLNDLLFTRVFSPIGVAPEALTWRNNSYRDTLIDGLARREFGSGIDANVDAMARIGYLYLRGGEWNGQRILPETFVDQVSQPAPGVAGLPVRNAAEHPNASDHYGVMWWNNRDARLAGVPTDAYWSWGLKDSLIVVIPSLDLVIARAGDGWRPGWNSDYSVLEPFIQPVAQSVSGVGAGQPTPYSPSALVTGIEWAPVESIVRAAPDSDTWPMTWGDDGALYTAYGDGFGFDSRPSKKLSLGYAKVIGPPTDFTGIDIPSATGEHTGGRHRGKKASGMLMVDSVLYAWVRNANNNGEQCQLARSTDHAVTWEWSPWTFAEFGYCAFLNFGQNYAGARDSFVYMYTPDTPSAYLETDAVVLTRVPMDRITEREAHEFFAGLDDSGEALWSANIDERQATFTYPGAANRLDVTYNAPLDRYLMTLRSQALNGGIDQFSIFDAPQPWGPWTTVYHTRKGNTDEPLSADIDWGEAQHIPSSWISEDGREFYLVFSGDDSFSVRRATLTVATDVTAPVVDILAPTEGAQVSGTVLITAQASDESVLESVAFAVNGTSIGTDPTAPYEMTWDTSDVIAGAYELTATATDTSGNQASDSIQVSVAPIDPTTASAAVTSDPTVPSGRGGGGSAGVVALLMLLAAATGVSTRSGVRRG